MLLFLSICSLPCTSRAELDSSQSALLDTIDANLRSDYRLCTGDSSELSVAALLEWRKKLDKTITSTNYAAITKKYFKETGLSPADVRPCEIIAWITAHEEEMNSYAALLDESRDTIQQRRDDSLSMAADYAKNPEAPFDLLGVPFGITRRSFMTRAATLRHYTFIDRGLLVVVDDFPGDCSTCSVAFHFTSDSIYRAYEMESEMCAFDSLNTRARPIMVCMASQLEARTATPPDHIYRVGQFDIVPGRLAICRLWTFPNANAYIGLARSGNSFYAKTIVQQK